MALPPIGTTITKQELNQLPAVGATISKSQLKGLKKEESPKKPVNKTRENTAKVGEFLGMGAFGQGIGYALGQFTPEVRAAREAQAAEQQMLSNVPKETLRRMAREGKSFQPSGSIQDLESATTGGLSNKQVIGSALATALTATGGSIGGSLSKAVSPVGNAVTQGLTGAGRPLLGQALGRATTAGLSAAPLGAATGGAVSAAQGGTNKDITKSTLIGGLISGAIPFGVEGGRYVATQVGKGAANLTGILTGQGGQVNQELARRANAGDMGKVTEFRNWRSSTELPDEARKAVDIVHTARNNRYQADLAALQGPGSLDISDAKDALNSRITSEIRGKITEVRGSSTVPKINTTSTVNETKALRDTLKSYGIKAPQGLSQDEMLTQLPGENAIQEYMNRLAGNKAYQAPALRLSLKQTKFPKDSQAVVKDVFETMNTWKDTSVGGIDALKQRLSRIAFNAPKGSPEKQLAVEATKSVEKILNESVPGYQAMTKNYSTLTKAMNEFEQVLGLKKNKLGDMNITTSFNKLLGALKDNKPVQFEALKKLSEMSGVDLTGMVVGASTRTPIPGSGIGRAALGATLPALATPFSATTAPYLAATAALSSPRLIGRAAITAGQISRILSQANNSPQGARILPQLLSTIAGQKK